ncbi:right-handed parallel beta-helix repeat-containing protein [Leptolyngbya sp. 7M]|uniref:right-handed parallel beta-helix repeat-containing protein n=1 Tax=Leptolyngbya sp. 7M TaxID=2812896 RepID=UPI001B8BE40A|nr:FG-GAP-like repeat-containing protein [Leptolyngbya sp. 7M]QYO67652.1 right-handed parallel beta-helix repeat-containing protein [Leptolyngbya sp. 7M]
MGDFIKSSKHTSEIALLTDDGRLHLFEKEEDNSFGSSRIIDLGAAIGSESSTSERKPIMLTARVSARPVDTLIIGSNSRIHLLTSDFIGPQNGSETADLASQAFGLQASLDAKQDLNAILPMRLNVDALSDLVILEDGSATPAIIQTEPMATYVVNSPLIDPDANPGDGFCLTFNGGCTLRAAIEEANNQPGSHTINFDIDVEGVPTTSGPGIGIFSPVVIDGTTQLAGLVEISGNAGVPANLFTGSQTDNCVFRGLVMNGIGPNYYMNPQGRNNIIEGNLIGTDAANENVIGNGGVGLSISSDLGGATQGASITFNTIAGNGSHGLLVSNGSNLNIQGNYVGASPKNSESFGNKGDGIRLENAPMDNNVSFNRIRSNGGTGINLATTSQFDLNNVFSYNEISDNGGLGIDLGGDGVTGNDLCDIDTGTNALQNFPIISTATRIGNNIRVVGSFNSVPNANYNLSFYANQTADPTGYGEGQTWLGDLSINVPASCQTNFTVMVPNNMQSGRCVSATAIDDDGNTSEFSNCVRIRNTPNSFDGDGLTDVAIYRPSVGQWWFLRSSDGSVFAAEFGTSTDRITPGDWTGDGVADMALWRPSTGEWFVVRSEDFSFFAFPFGSNGDIPTPADYDGDGIFDPTVFRPSAALWFVLRSSDGNVEISQFGSSGDKPVVADYDGDGRDDIAIFRPGPGEWWYRRSSDNTVTALQFGLSTDLPVQGDYTGDGKADIALWRPSIGFWYVLRSEDNSFFGFPWGSNGDIPAPADYDGDGRFDPAVFRPATTTWFIDRTTAGTSIFNFGSTGDKPVPSAYIPMP